MRSSAPSTMHEPRGSGGSQSPPHTSRRRYRLRYSRSQHEAPSVAPPLHITLRESRVPGAPTGCRATSRRWWYLPYAVVDYRLRKIPPSRSAVSLGLFPWNQAVVGHRNGVADDGVVGQELDLLDEGDNLNTHKLSSLYEAFEPSEARRIAERLEIHYTPKHGSWLNMAEIEIGVLSRQCLDRRMPNSDVLSHEVQAWQERRNRGGCELALHHRRCTHTAEVALSFNTNMLNH